MTHNLPAAVRTLCYVLDPNPPGRILLGLKKRGFGAGKYNGFGGKPEVGESILEAAIRELHEESGVRVDPSQLRSVALIQFAFLARPEWNQRVHVFLTETWHGIPVETEEMSPRWFPTNAIPYTQMWADDGYWLPRVLGGQRIRARFTFDHDNETICGAQVHPWHDDGQN